jgi:hypothetical protein
MPPPRAGPLTCGGHLVAARPQRASRKRAEQGQRTRLGSGCRARHAYCPSRPKAHTHRATNPCTSPAHEASMSTPLAPAHCPIGKSRTSTAHAALASTPPQCSGPAALATARPEQRAQHCDRSYACAPWLARMSYRAGAAGPGCGTEALRGCPSEALDVAFRLILCPRK